ncbi:MAG: DUF1098 domain-containing protein [Helicobacteraceae bacterium]|nr:DUF1098 domain-containing protein [Helicobacteraceae bacterium]
MGAAAIKSPPPPPVRELKNILALVAAALIGALGFSGCVSHYVDDFTVASSQNVRNLQYETIGEKSALATGSSCVHFIFGFPMGRLDERIQHAMDDAIRNGRRVGGLDGDLLVNVRIAHSEFSVFFYGNDCITVTGNLAKL